MDYFIISDTHFWHWLPIEVWDREKWFEKKILKQLSILPKEAILIHLWDVCIGNDTYWHEIMNKIPLRKILVKWNHDRKTYSWYLEHWWDFVCDTFTIDIFNKRVIFSHQPITNHWCDINIHWHQHRKFNRDAGNIFKWRCYSCEEENYVPIKLTHKFLDNLVLQHIDINPALEWVKQWYKSFYVQNWIIKRMKDMWF